MNNVNIMLNDYDHYTACSGACGHGQWLTKYKIIVILYY